MREKGNKEHYASQLAIFLNEVVQCMEGVNGQKTGLEVLTRRTPEQIKRMIPELLNFPSMSFLELHYRSPERQAVPGLRFLLEETKSGRQLRTILFQDIVFWNVDNNMNKIQEDLVIFRLEGEEIQAAPSQSLLRKFGNTREWRHWLRHALAYPIPSY